MFSLKKVVRDGLEKDKISFMKKTVFIDRVLKNITAHFLLLTISSKKTILSILLIHFLTLTKDYRNY